MTQPAPSSTRSASATPPAAPPLAAARTWSPHMASDAMAWQPSPWFTLHRWVWLIIAVAATVLASGCATPTQIKPDAVSYGSWPGDRAPGTFTFERLPSQEAQGERRSKLEASASAALQRAGFKPAPSPDAADVLVQASAYYITVAPYEPYWGPYWYGRPRVYLSGAVGYGHFRGPYFAHGRGGYGYGFGYRAFPRAWGPMPTQILEASLVLRDRKSQKIIHEARARYDFPWNNDPALVEALFDAALQDFPTPKSRRTVTVPIPKPAAAAEGEDDTPDAAAAPASNNKAVPAPATPASGVPAVTAPAAAPVPASGASAPQP